MQNGTKMGKRRGNFAKKEARGAIFCTKTDGTRRYTDGTRAVQRGVFSACYAIRRYRGDISAVQAKKNLAGQKKGCTFATEIETERDRGKKSERVSREFNNLILTF